MICPSALSVPGKFKLQYIPPKTHTQMSTNLHYGKAESHKLQNNRMWNMGSFLLFQDYIALLPRYHGAPDWLHLPANGLQHDVRTQQTYRYLPPQETQQWNETNQKACSKPGSIQTGLLFQGAEQTTSPNSNLDNKKQKSFNSESVPAKGTRKQVQDLPWNTSHKPLSDTWALRPEPWGV